MKKSEHWTAEEYRTFVATGKEPKRNAGNRGASGGLSSCSDGNGDGDHEKQRKYRNHPTYEDGFRFDSLHEAQVYRDLKTRVRAGELKCIVRQVGFDLPGGIRYFADFVTIRPDNTIEVIDAKSEITRKNQVYINKKKQMLSCWGG